MEETVYEKLIALVPGLALGQDWETANTLILNEVVRLNQEMAIRDAAILYMTNGIATGNNKNEEEEE